MRNIAVFIGNRADAGPMGPVVEALKERGMTVSEAEWYNNIMLHDFEEHEDIEYLVVLGDRHELLPVCHWALYRQIPIAHIHGGETTLGSFDDKVRNAVTQLADLHFVAAQPFADKVISMGVNSDRVWVVGPPGLDDLETDEVSEFGEGFFLVCLHPDTTQNAVYNVQMATNLAHALQRFEKRRVVIISPNDDPGGREIENVLRPANESVVWAGSLPRRRYLTALKHAAVCIGNSSSFVIEAPALGTPVMLVGDRQKGRPLAWPIVRTAPCWGADDIERGIRMALANRDKMKDAFLPYGRGGASSKIAEILATCER